MPHLTDRQRAAAVANWEAGRAIFDDGRSFRPHPNPLPAGEGTSGNSPHPNSRRAGGGTEYGRKIVFVAPHCLIDPTSGAAVATAQAMRFLQTLGFQCRAFCGARLDLPEDVEKMLQRHRIAYRQSTMAAGNSQVPVFVASLAGLAIADRPQRLKLRYFPTRASSRPTSTAPAGPFSTPTGRTR